MQWHFLSSVSREGLYRVSWALRGCDPVKCKCTHSVMSSKPWLSAGLPSKCLIRHRGSSWEILPANWTSALQLARANSFAIQIYYVVCIWWLELVLPGGQRHAEPASSLNVKTAQVGWLQARVWIFWSEHPEPGDLVWTLLLRVSVPPGLPLNP